MYMFAASRGKLKSRLNRIQQFTVACISSFIGTAKLTVIEIMLVADNMLTF